MKKEVEAEKVIQPGQNDDVDREQPKRNSL